MLPFEITYIKKSKVNPKKVKNAQAADKPGRIDTMVVNKFISPLAIKYKKTDEKDPPVKPDHFIGYSF